MGAGPAGGDPAVRELAPADVDAVVEAFHANTRARVAAPERDGFVQGNLSATAVSAMALQRGVWVAEAQGRVVGFLCSSAGAVDGPPPAREIHRRAGELTFAGRPLTDQRWIMYGPVVIDPAFRGSGLLRRLFAAVVQAWRSRADAGVAFVDESNPRSMHAHVDGLGMTPIGRFDLDGRGYAVLAFAIPPA